MYILHKKSRFTILSFYIVTEFSVHTNYVYLSCSPPVPCYLIVIYGVYLSLLIKKVYRQSLFTLVIHVDYCTHHSYQNVLDIMIKIHDKKKHEGSNPLENNRITINLYDRNPRGN